MLGTVGVAPAGREVRSSLCRTSSAATWTPRDEGGTTCFLGVNVEGALFSVGDGHYRQGEARAAARPSRARWTSR